MAGVSGRAALGAGFELIRREPAAFAAWCATYFVLGALPSLWLIWQLGPVYGEMFSGDFDPASPEFAQLTASANLAQLVSWIFSVFVQTLLAGAVFRAVLQPHDRRHFYLRLSGQEGWLALSVVVLIVLLIIGAFVAMIPLIIVGVILTLIAGGEAAGGLIAFLVAMAALGAALWVWLRLSMGPVMSFAERNFRLFESWSLTKGHAWKLFLVGFALVVLIVLVQIVVIGLLAGVANALVPLTTLRDAFAQNPADALRRLAPVAVVGYLALTVLGTAMYVLYAAAWADIYRQLTGGEASVFE